MSKPLSELISNMLEIDIKEVKEIIPTMSLTDIVDITDALRNDDYDRVFDIYNGYLI